MDEAVAGQIFTWSMAEELAVAHLRSIGFADAHRTGSGRDGGLDAVGTDVVAQVKNHAQPVGAPDVQRLRGAGHGTTHAVFYSRAGYTPAAQEFAGTAAVALFTFNAANVVTPANGNASALMDAPRGSDPQTHRVTPEFVAEHFRSDSAVDLVTKLTSIRDAVFEIQARSERAQGALSAARVNGLSADVDREGLSARISELRDFRDNFAEVDHMLGALGEDAVGLFIISRMDSPPEDAIDLELQLEGRLHAVTERIRRAEAEQVTLLSGFARALRVQLAPLLEGETATPE